jgi:hypothetical protein
MKLQPLLSTPRAVPTVRTSADDLPYDDDSRHAVHHTRAGVQLALDSIKPSDLFP